MLFVIVWLLTFGKHHLWILPNLTEDVGFFESFKPWYKHDSYSKTEENEEENKDDNVDKESSPNLAIEAPVENGADQNATDQDNNDNEEAKNSQSEDT